MPDSEVIKSSILIVDDEEEHAQVMCEALQRLGHRCDVTYNLGEARARMQKKNYDVIVTDLVMEGKRDGLEVLELSQEIQEPQPPVILVTAHADIPTCKEALSKGAYDYITKPLDLEYFRAQVNRAAEKSSLQKANQVLRERVDIEAGFEEIVGNSAAMRQVIQTARQVAMSDIPVLILGENGTGKELIAKAIHNSSQQQGQLVTMNCAGMPETILEDELFGHVKGAFTDARTERAGRFEHADKGTLFMDEIGDMPQNMQAKLLRVLENGEVVRLGSNDPIQVDVRLISATNKNVEEMVADKQFREDLYYRIKGVVIDLPPLRERRDDIPLLIHFFLQQLSEKYERPIEGVKPDAQQILISYSWPGNVRELRMVLEQMMVLSQGPWLGVENLPQGIRPALASGNGEMKNLTGLTIEQVEREHIRSTLEAVEGNREAAARILGIGERTLYRKIKEFGIE